MLSAIYGGIGPAIFSAVAGAAIAGFLFLGPTNSLRLQGDDLLRLVIFLSVAVICGWLSGARRRSEDALRRAHRELEQRVHERTVSLEKVNHQLQAEVTQRRKADEGILAHQQRLRSLAVQLSTSEEHERRRLACALHDAVGHRLAVVAMKLEAVLQAPHAPEQERPIRQARKLVDEIIGCTRSLTTELSPPVLYEVGLPPALEWLGERFHEEHALEVNVATGDLPEEITEEVRSLLFSAVRELLMNVIKHSGAARVVVSLGFDRDEVVVSVSDDGRGCDPGQINSSAGGGGFGLFHIRERITSLGGRIAVDAPPCGGCTVTMAVPVSAAAASHGLADAQQAGAT